MEINKENKFKRLFKKFGALAVACVVVVAVALAIAFSVGDKVGEVSTTPIEFGLPMHNASIIKDYSDTRLQHVEGTKKYEIHLSVDFACDEDCGVMAVYDGIVKDVESNTQEGTVVTIEHADGFVSQYASLNEKVQVKEGDRVQKGQKIGDASQSANYERGLNCNHLHFTLFKDGLEVDPNNYLDLQNK